MQTIKELLNQIKWDESLTPGHYVLFYEEKKEGRLKEVKYADVKRIEGDFMILERKGKEVDIPLHLIREVRMKEKLVWSRNPLKV